MHDRLTRGVSHWRRNPCKWLYLFALAGARWWIRTTDPRRSHSAIAIRRASPAGPLLIRTLRRLRLARLCLRRGREHYRAVAEALHVAVERLGELDKAINRLRAQNTALRDELRRFRAPSVGGPTKGRAA